MPKAVKKKTTKKTSSTARKRTTTSRASAKKNVRVTSKATDADVCKNPTTLFEVEFPTTVLFWAGVALFFLLILLIAQTVLR